MMMPNSNLLSIGIVGAGTAGLASAIALARLGHAVTVSKSMLP
jgi:2-polyprenyl-6-methoxyphenol hydroxylase-like FAD-dependent oxidoreductase